MEVKISLHGDRELTVDQIKQEVLRRLRKASEEIGDQMQIRGWWTDFACYLTDIKKEELPKLPEPLKTIASRGSEFYDYPDRGPTKEEIKRWLEELEKQA